MSEKLGRKVTYLGQLPIIYSTGIYDGGYITLRINQKRMLVLFVLTIIMLITNPAFAQPTDNQPKVIPQEKSTNLVLFIIADGLQGDALNNTAAPNINGLSASGLKTERVTPVYPEDSVLAINSMLTGVSYRQSSESEKPNILSIMESKNIRTGLYDGTEKLTNLTQGISHVAKGPYQGKDQAVADSVLAELGESNTYFNVVIFPELRSVLEEHGANSPEYFKQVTNTDNQVGRILHYLHRNGLYDHSFIVVTGTFGEPPLVMKGPQLKVGTILPPVNAIDIAPTITYLTGIRMTQVDGMVLFNAVKPREDLKETYLLSQRVNDLSKAYATALDGMHRLEQEKIEVKKQQDIVAQEKMAIQQEIDVRDEKIQALSNKIAMMKTGAVVVLIILGLGYYVEYRILRKRFLMF